MLPLLFSLTCDFCEIFLFLQRVDALHKLLWNFSFTLLMNYSTRKNLHIFFALSWNLNSRNVWTLPHYTATTAELPPRHGAKLFLAFYNHLFDSIHRRDGGVIRLRSTMHYFISNTIRACYYIWGNMWSVRACNSHPMIFIRVFFLYSVVHFKHTQYRPKVPKLQSISPCASKTEKRGRKGKHHRINCAPLNLFKRKKKSGEAGEVA